MDTLEKTLEAESRNAAKGLLLPPVDGWLSEGKDMRGEDRERLKPRNDSLKLFCNCSLILKSPRVSRLAKEAYYSSQLDWRSMCNSWNTTASQTESTIRPLSNHSSILICHSDHDDMHMGTNKNVAVVFNLVFPFNHHFMCSRMS